MFTYSPEIRFVLICSFVWFHVPSHARLFGFGKSRPSTAKSGKVVSGRKAFYGDKQARRRTPDEARLAREIGRGEVAVKDLLSQSENKRTELTIRVTREATMPRLTHTQRAFRFTQGIY